MRLRFLDWLFVALAFLGTALVYCVGLDAFEFFRHTEADRTLIAWEMIESGDYLVPHLLGSEILTKPPLFYWAVALSVTAWGGTAEWVARFPSVIFGATFVAFTVMFYLFLGYSRQQALVAGGIFATGALFREYTAVAEIDMLYAFLSGVGFCIGFLAIERASLGFTIAAFLALAVAFLAKGPPALVIYGLSFLTYVLWDFYDSPSRRHWEKICKNHAIAFVLTAPLILVWILLLAARVGWAALAEQFQVEIFERAFSSSAHVRGPSFYLGVLFVSILPWTLLPCIATVKRVQPQENISRRFFRWNIVIVLVALFVLSCSSGKSSRYLFPACHAWSSVASLCLFALHANYHRQLLFRCCQGIGVLAISLGIIGPLVFPYHEVSQAVLLSIGAVLILLGSSLYIFSRKLHSVGTFVVLTVLLLFGRVGEVSVLAPIRNSERSVKNLAAEIHAALPAGKKIYTVEFFDRWVNYYLKRLGRESLRLSASEARRLREIDQSLVLLLDEEQERWRYDKLQSLGISARIIGEFRSKKEHVLLIETNGRRLFELQPKEQFPTQPTAPF